MSESQKQTLTLVLGPQRENPPNPHLSPSEDSYFVVCQEPQNPPARGPLLLDRPGRLQAPLVFLLFFLTLPAAQAGPGDL